MPRKTPGWREPILAGFLRWLVRLRWFAGAALVCLGLIPWRVLHWYGPPLAKVAVGLAVIAYNLALWLLLRRDRYPRHVLVALAWVQITLDVFALTLLSLWTGGVHSPFMGLFVLHMVFASLLLPRPLAYGGAGATVVIFLGGLGAAGRWPGDVNDKRLVVAWAGTLLATVFVGTHIARALRKQRRRLLRQNRRILSMTRQIRRQQRNMAQHEKMVALGQMAAGVAHEIANPLASMDSLLQLMLRKPEKLRPESLTTLREQIDRIGQIVRELTTFSRPGEEQAQWQTMAVNEVVSESLNLVSHDKRVRQAKVESELATDVGTARMLPQALQQVLVNLLRNALDATADVEQPRIRVRTAREEDWVIIEVSDNGHGIAPGNLRRLFEPFFTTKPVGHGTGLGLSISYSIVRKHGGLITARSREGEGATFTVKLPAERKGAVTAKG